MTVGASGAIFGLLGAMVVVQWQSTGSIAGPATTLILVNLAITFAIPGISWGGHLGGLKLPASDGCAVVLFEELDALAGDCETRVVRALHQPLLQEIPDGEFEVLARAPGFTLVATMTLALGIGAVTVIYSVVRNVVLDPFPYTRSERLVNVVQCVPQERVENVTRMIPQYETVPTVVTRHVCVTVPYQTTVRVPVRVPAAPAPCAPGVVASAAPCHH